MTYNEWRDELKNNLLSVTESERRRVLDYYAEAYADRREAGFSEHEIIQGFGAPYDAAQRILRDNDGYFDDEPYEQERVEEQSKSREKRTHRDNCKRNCESSYSSEIVEKQTNNKSSKEKDISDDYTWVFVLLCIIFAVPLFAVVMAMTGLTIGICVAPFAMMASGVASIIMGFVGMFSDFLYGVSTVGVGLIVLGLSIILIPLCIKLVKLMWKLFKKFFRWVRSLFSGKKERA